MTVKRTLITALISSLCGLTASEEYQVANRAGYYEVESAVMPRSVWSNCVFWLADVQRAVGAPVERASK